jgi:hypothetical protein
MRSAALLLCLAIVVLTSACAPARAPTVGQLTVRSTDGTAIPLDTVLRDHQLTVVSFFSAQCPCQRAHDVRLRELRETYAPRGVGFLVVDSERTSTPTADAEEARRRSYPIVLDDGGRLARSLAAEYATYSVILNPRGDVIYRGGIDSDRSHLRDTRVAYLADALDDALAGRPVRLPEAKALGCALELQ